LRQPHQSKARLRFPPEPACLPVGRLGQAELTLQAVDLPLPVGGVAESPLIQDSLGETLGDPTRFFQRVAPRTTQRHDLGAMHQAQALVRHHVGLLIAPPRQGGGPLAGAAQLVHVATERDRVAIDDAGDDRRQLPRGDGDHGLVHQPQALLLPTLFDQGVSLLHQCHCN
jgi:hypothetical protein